MKKVFLLITVAVLLTGCGRVADRSKADRIAKSYTNNFELVSETSNMDGDENEQWSYYTYKDTNCGFEFSVYSSKVAQGMDGSVFYYSPHSSSDYSEKYWDYIISKSPELNNYECKFIDDINWGKSLSVVASEDTAEATAVKVYSLIHSVDKNNYLADVKIAVRKGEVNGEIIGKFCDGKWSNSGEIQFDWMCNYANQTYGNAEYIGIETVRSETLPELVEQATHIVDENLPEEVKIYKFKDLDFGFTYYICEHYVFGQQYYNSNYKEKLTDFIDVPKLAADYNVSIVISDSDIVVSPNNIYGDDKAVVIRIAEMLHNKKESLNTGGDWFKNVYVHNSSGLKHSQAERLDRLISQKKMKKYIDDIFIIQVRFFAFI